jgi:hypothetical protein
MARKYSVRPKYGVVYNEYKNTVHLVGGDVDVYSEINTKTRAMLIQLARSNKQLKTID